MHYQTVHRTTYTYAQPVTLGPHLIRLRPRSNGWQSLKSFTVEIWPEPAGWTEFLDLEGNALTRVWFKDSTQSLQITAKSRVETHCENPFNYLLEPWAVHLPIEYPSSLLAQLHPYFYPLGIPKPIDPGVVELATDIRYQANNQVVAFLSQLNQAIYERSEHRIRETGPPHPPGITWKEGTGSCRDFALLFMEACRAVGLAARLVSGYQEGDPEAERRDLHAWAEVYLPGAGWRGYDPTQGLVVGDRHISLVAHVDQRQTVPISGKLHTLGVKSEMTFELSIQPLEWVAEQVMTSLK
ncbi:transglutaminase family protein [Desertifilum sp. FACHB-1129]|uniref:Transglutaminase n=1 Tax=Desertifilum tharense IPPAS B-1220 TaxID=1781255 RepID=A0A1E5QLU6_9CYAN|nr:MULTISPECIES: transglutaminase family protein [Desertifilum]MDA0211986.1 transglutaminase family protein [Cyanobacteria bacterium FC1]MBD2313288.1 transglutaminase family protein [Desertifilum sp. FACHB-1129]MBD2324251.1 transglutaminase family protein [Desertifilum sp. FACHB-866]MBD2334265.1 transglutaminase family protein [Desertifilum sp. FACHB-868]OEJ75598.1 transglutaminase [Desertifilum tharense IPPAS B-1220]